MNKFYEANEFKYVVRVFQGQNIFLTLNVLILFAQIIYLIIRYQYINELVPFWYVKPWGSFQLGEKPLLFLLPMLSAINIISYIFLTSYLKRYYFRFSIESLAFLSFFFNGMVLISLFRIVGMSSVPYAPLINPFFIGFALLFLTTFFLVFFITPQFIKYYIDKGIVTDPADHTHPGMALVRPSARGGGVVFFLGMLAVSLVFVKFDSHILNIYIIGGIIALLGLVDDYQNTHPKTIWNFFEKPSLRLLTLISLALSIALSGVRIDFITNPFGGVIYFDAISVTLLGRTLYPVSILITVIWIVWVMNLLSWSNGIDGQYSGLVGIVCVVIALLALRFTPLEIQHINLAKIAVISAGASLGLLPFNWHPSNIMWGFGAMSVGFIIASLSILIGTKINITILAIILPFLDALISIFRRIALKKNPLKGDRGHLHHLLMKRGWSPQKISYFYWGTTALFGLLGLLMSEKMVLQATLMIAGLVASLILILNINSFSKK